MAQSDLLESLLAGTAPANVRALVARGSVPLPPKVMIEMLVCLLRDADPSIASQASQTLHIWDRGEILRQLKTRGCAAAVLEHFAAPDSPVDFLQAVIANPSSPHKLVASLALTVPATLLESILDNRVRILEAPDILESIRRNPAATSEILRLVGEVETEFFGGKRQEYVVESSAEVEPSPVEDLVPESGMPPEDLSLEGLPVDPEARQAAMAERLSALPFRERLRHALYGTREIRMVLVRDTNKELARAALRSPKLTESEVEAIAAMRTVTEEVLREIGNSREWTKSYNVVQNLVKNPKTPPLISQRLLFRLHSKDLALLTRDRSIPDAVRYNATRALNQRKPAGSSR
jgi:hypothetical protein